MNEKDSVDLARKADLYAEDHSDGDSRPVVVSKAYQAGYLCALEVFRKEHEFLRKVFNKSRIIKAYAEENAELKAKVDASQREIVVLRQYGNKQCTAMADEFLASGKRFDD